MRHEIKNNFCTIINNSLKITDLSRATLDPLHLPELAAYPIRADVLRLDKIHPVISGNKWFKLKYYLAHALQERYATLLTFGGPYSNHIVATACAARDAGLKSIGIIRGERPLTLSHTLLDAIQYGMELQFISREAYRKKTEGSFLQTIPRQYPGAYLIPEGGAGREGIRGCEEILKLVDNSRYTHILCAVGTATLLLGLANASRPEQELLGISVLKGFETWPVPGLATLLHPEKLQNCRLIGDYHFGGYARKPDELLAFMNTFFARTGIPTDFVYTAKLFYGVLDLIGKRYFPPDSNLLVIHSGGLQGNESLDPETLRY